MNICAAAKKFNIFNNQRTAPSTVQGQLHSAFLSQECSWETSQCTCIGRSAFGSSIFKGSPPSTIRKIELNSSNSTCKNKEQSSYTVCDNRARESERPKCYADNDVVGFMNDWMTSTLHMILRPSHKEYFLITIPLFHFLLEIHPQYLQVGVGGWMLVAATG